MPERTRFAPSPTGLLHLGHVRAAAFSWSRARLTGGRFLVRIEDLDRGRCRPAYADAALADLRWLDFAPDEAVRVQSEHMAEYAEALRSLTERGLGYPCFCTRSAIRREVASMDGAPHDPDGSPVYPGTCRRLSPSERDRRVAAGLPYVLRLDMAEALRRIGPSVSYETEHGEHVACDPSRFGDVVLGRRDAPASYHLAVTHDDARAAITLVTRADDLRPATAIHRVLQDLFGWPQPRYAFHPLMLDDGGRRLAKRQGAASVRSFRERGFSPDEVKTMAETCPVGSSPLPA